MLEKIFKQFHQKWALVTAGNEADFNTMTISWGSLGTLWSKPVATVYVKPCRYTYSYLNENDYFTISFFPEKYHEDLLILGTRSKRDGDKLGFTKLTPKFLKKGITFQEAECCLICKKIYVQDLDIQNMPKQVVDDYYSIEEPHRMFVGEVIDVINIAK